MLKLVEEFVSYSLVIVIIVSRGYCTTASLMTTPSFDLRRKTTPNLWFQLNNTISSMYNDSMSDIHLQYDQIIRNLNLVTRDLFESSVESMNKKLIEH